MSLSTGTATSGDWVATFKTDDTHDYIYRIVFTATDDKGQKSIADPIFK